MALTTNLVSCYLFGATVTADNEGNYALTNSGVTSNSTGTKVEATNGRWDGTDHMTQGAAATNSLTQGTIAFWVKFDTEAVSHNLYGKNSAAFRSQYDTGNDDFYTYINTGDTADYTTANGDWTGWRHVIIAWDGSNKYQIVDGVVSKKTANTQTSPSSGDLYLGHNSVNTSDRLQGYFEQFAVWNIIIDGIAGKAQGASVTGDAASLYNSGSGLARSSWGGGGGGGTTYNAAFFGAGI